MKKVFDARMWRVIAVVAAVLFVVPQSVKAEREENALFGIYADKAVVEPIRDSMKMGWFFDYCEGRLVKIEISAYANERGYSRADWLHMKKYQKPNRGYKTAHWTDEDVYYNIHES
jgi:hypothetical protein